MAEDDIYHSKRKYERFFNHIDTFTNKPIIKKGFNNQRAKYYCKNRVNLQYIKAMHSIFESRDLSYVRRIRLLNQMKIITFCTGKDLKELERADIDAIIVYMHTINKSMKSKSDFIRDIKFLWKQLFPEMDSKGRMDETQIPYVVRHLKQTIDVSRQKARPDKITFDEFETILRFFNYDKRIQSYLAIAWETAARPQEILWRKIKDIDFFSKDDYALINLSSHGKEGIGTLPCIDSYQYLIGWLNTHPLRQNKEAFIFINTNNRINQQLRPTNINRMLKKACKALKIDKRVTVYSIKRATITNDSINGVSPTDIQKKARWKSLKQLSTYDLSDQRDYINNRLIQAGIKEGDSTHKKNLEREKTCIFCGEKNPFTNEFCNKCKRILDRDKLALQIQEQEKAKINYETLANALCNTQVMKEIQDAVTNLKNEIENLKNQ